MTIYTAGYIGHSANSLKKLAENLNATVVDIRISPRSQNPAYEKQALAKLLGDRYVHIPAWGNINYKSEGLIQIANFMRGLELFEAIQGTTILLCACKGRERCHRDTVARMLGVEIPEIAPAQWNSARWLAQGNLYE